MIFSFFQNFQHFAIFDGNFDEKLSEFRDKFQKIEKLYEYLQIFLPNCVKIPRNFAQPKKY